MSDAAARETTSEPAGDTTEDGFLDGRITMRQPAKGYRAGIDAVLLAASIQARSGERVLEAGAGVGVASACLAARVEGLEVEGIELQPELVTLAAENIRRNGFADRVSILEGDIGLPVRDLAAMGLEPNSYHHVFANPPFHDPSASPASPNESKAKSHMTLGSDLEDWVRFTCIMARPKGTVTFIHRADALAGLLAAFQGHVGGIEVFPLWPAIGKTASRVIVRGVRGSRAPLVLRQGLVLHRRDGRFSEAAEAILRGGEALRFDRA